MEEGCGEYLFTVQGGQIGSWMNKLNRFWIYRFVVAMLFHKSVRGAYCVFSFLNLRLSAEDYLLRLQTTYRLEDRDVDTVLNSLYMKFGLTRPV